MDNRKLLKLGILVVFLIVGISACNEPEDPQLREVTVSLTEENRNFLFNTSAARSKARSNGIGGPAGFIFRLGGGVFSPEGNGRSAEKHSPLLTMRQLVSGGIDSKAWRTITLSETTPNELPDCVKESFIENSDGSYTYILDFGSGCDLFGDFFKGKLIEKGLYGKASFTANVEYQGFGTDFWEVNGTYNYEGFWEFPKDAQDSLEFDWKAEFLYSYDMEETYLDEDDTFSLTTSGNGKEILNDEGFTIVNLENIVTYDTGEQFSSVVNVPLHLDYSCGEEIFIFVSGEESGKYTFGDVSAEYSINYGDGDCDNLIIVLENGEEYVIDLDEVYNELDENADED
ncbi:MAG: hypothetical protein AAFQ94_14960 [Bacteroidota bacterium]